MGDEYTDAIARLREEGLDDLADTFSQFEKSTLREKAGKAATLEKELATIREENESLKAAPKRSAALKAANVDVGRLSPAELEIIESQRVGEGKEYDEDWAKGLVEKYKLPVTEGGESSEAPPNAAPFGEVGGPNNTGGRAPKAAGALKAAEVAKWKPEKRMAFREWCDKNGKNDVWEALLQGQDVTGVTFAG